MPLLLWDELDFLECLEVVPETEAYGTYFTYRIEKNAHTLLLTVSPFESVVHLTLSAALSENSLVELVLFVRGPVRHINDRRGEWLEFQNCLVGPSRSWRREVGDPFDEDHFRGGVTVEVAVKPEIRIRLQ